MDPKANIAEQLEIAAWLVEAAENGRAIHPQDQRLLRLAELVIALDEWRSAGGFDPYLSGRPWRGSM